MGLKKPKQPNKQPPSPPSPQTAEGKEQRVNSPFLHFKPVSLLGGQPSTLHPPFCIGNSNTAYSFYVIQTWKIILTLDLYPAEKFQSCCKTQYNKTTVLGLPDNKQGFFSV